MIRFRSHLPHRTAFCLEFVPHTAISLRESYYIVGGQGGRLKDIRPLRQDPVSESQVRVKWGLAVCVCVILRW